MSKASRKRIIAEVEKTSPLRQNTRSKKVKQTTKSKEPIRTIPELEEIDIFEYIKDKDTSIKGLIEGLEEKAGEYPDKVMEDLLVFILKAFGYSEASLGVEVRSDLEVNVNDLLKHIYDINVKKNLNSFPLLVRKRELKRFKTNYASFWSKLIVSSEAIVFETKILESLIKALVGFSKSKLRTIRFGSAETLGIILTVVLDMLVKLNEDQKRQDSHIEAQAGTDKEAKEFKKNKEEVKNQVKRLSKLTDIIMKEFLKKRSEDAMPEIRVKVLELLTLTAKRIPRLGYDESLLTMVRGLLSTDPEPQVIRACLDFIDQVAQPQEGGVDKTFQKSLRAMKKDLFELCFNSTVTVAAKAFRFVKSHISALDFKDEEIKQLGLLVFYEDEGMAAVAADFLDMMYFNGELLNDMATNEEFVFLKEQEQSRSQLFEMAILYEQLGPIDVIDDKPEKFVRAFFRKTQILFDFQGILGLVVDEKVIRKNRSSEDTLSNKEKKILLRLMLASIKVCKTYVDTSLPHEKALKPYAERILTHAAEVVRYRAQELLTNMKLEEELLADLLPIFEETDLTLFFSEENEESYKAFMATLSDVFQISQNSKVIESAVRVYNNLEKIPTIQREVLRTIKTLCRSLLKDFQENFESYLNDLVLDRKGDQRAEKIILESLMKLHKMSIHFIVDDMADSAFIEKISDALDSFVNKFPVPADFALHSINILFYVHLWKLRILLTKADISEDDCMGYINIRNKLIEKLSVCFMVDDSIKRLSTTENQSQGTKLKLLRLQESSFTLLIETLCIISSDRFFRVDMLFYQPTNELLKALQNYVFLLESSATPVAESQLFNSGSKKLIEGLKKSRFMIQDDGSDDEDEDEDKPEEDEENKAGDEAPKPAQNKPKAIDQKGPEKLDERLHFACSLIIKLFMQCSRVLLTDFGLTLTIHFIKSPYRSIETLTKVLLGKIKSQELEESEGPVRMNYWRFIDGILLKLYQEGDLKKACEVARMAAKLYFEKYDKLEERKKFILSEKYLKYLVNCILYAISEPKHYNFLSVLIILGNKNYLDKENYKKLLAFFEVELKQREKEREDKKQQATEAKDRGEEEKKSEVSDIVFKKAEPEEEGQEGQEGEKEEEKKEEKEEKEKPKDDNEMVDEAKEKEEAEYLNRFRQHMCKIAGLKYTNAKEAGKASAKKTRASSAKKQRVVRKVQKDDTESEIDVEEPKNDKESDKEQEEPEEEEKAKEKENESDKQKEKEESVMEIKSDKKEIEKEEKARGKKKQIKSVKGQKKAEPKKANNSKKRKNREYTEEVEKPKEVEEVEEMVKGKQKTKKVKRNVK